MFRYNTEEGAECITCKYWTYNECIIFKNGNYYCNECTSLSDNESDNESDSETKETREYIWNEREYQTTIIEYCKESLKLNNKITQIKESLK